MTFIHYDSDIVAMPLPELPGQQHTFAVVAATGDGFTISRGTVVGETFVACEHEYLSISDHPELGDLYVAGYWNTTMLTQLLWPCEQGSLSILRNVS